MQNRETWQRAHGEYLSRSARENVQRAFELAEKMHVQTHGHAHTMAVAMRLADMHADQETLITALLRPAVEEGSLTLQRVESEFGKGIAALIGSVMTSFPREGERERLRSILASSEKDMRPLVILLVDCLCRMQTVDALPHTERAHRAREVWDIYAKLADKLCMQDLREELEGFCLSILEPDLFAKLHALRAQDDLQVRETIIPGMQEALRLAHPSLEIRLHHEHAPWQSLRKQCTQAKTTAAFPSPRSIVLVSKHAEDCYRILGLLHQTWRQAPLSFRDYINTPRINGYQGIHTTIFLPNGTHVRCKIRTQEMQEYARKGIAVLCFNHELLGLSDYLPWLERVRLLSEDTKDSSREFLRGLQNDIFVAHIAVQGTDGQTALLPEGATALDGAFFLYGARALWTDLLFVNEQEVSSGSPLAHGTVLTARFDAHRRVERKWLKQVRTSAVAAIIRTALGKAPDSKKVEIGKQLLQEAMHAHRRGFIEEYKEEGFSAALQSMGFHSLANACMAVASGSVEPEEVYNALFKPQESQRPTPHPLTVKVQCIGFVACIILAWGLDPVLAKMLLGKPWNVHPFDFTVTRFIGFFLAASLTIVLTRKRGLHPAYKKLPLGDGFLWCAASSLVFTGLATYLSLRSLLPQEYITITYASTILIPILLSPFHRGEPRKNLILWGAASVFVSLTMLKLVHQEIPWETFAAGVLLLFSFSIFSICVDEFKRRNAVLARLPTFLFQLSILSLLLSFLLLPFSSLFQLDVRLFLILVLYGMVMTGIPYVLYYRLGLTEAAQTLARFFVFATILTLAAQYLLLHVIHMASLLPLGIVCFATHLFHRTYRYPSMKFAIQGPPIERKKSGA